jgi:hypothetical protein
MKEPNIPMKIPTERNKISMMKILTKNTIKTLAAKAKRPEESERNGSK